MSNIVLVSLTNCIPRNNFARKNGVSLCFTNRVNFEIISSIFMMAWSHHIGPSGSRLTYCWDILLTCALVRMLPGCSVDVALLLTHLSGHHLDHPFVRGILENQGTIATSVTLSRD